MNFGGCVLMCLYEVFGIRWNEFRKEQSNKNEYVSFLHDAKYSSVIVLNSLRNSA